MSQMEARRRALASCGAFLIGFIGVVHEVLGPTLFPWAPAWFGPMLWHGIGLLCIVLGLFTLAGTLRLVAFPVISAAMLASACGLGGLVLAASRGEFHFFAFCIILAGIATAVFHHQAERIRRIEPSSRT
jgi:hypothetical protein